ncbi:hypothetical protein MAPG_11341 [Magnaporthiopsis poae ATCC 64411]|uniref:Uncharacterized protein n=1 Tax=Magnaporthiopsis poae (strain ATCC 64411 / 73-15) TaxID=644358 RepID=A0A0C4EF07_MAGP6|nr:hypothetical protein MAPG_11341 [Magnaporthiopsis poae ATCC 64411]
MGQRRGKEVPVITIHREVPLAAVAGPSALPGRNAQPQPQADKREKDHGPTATYQCETEGEDEEDDGVEEGEEEDGDAESSESTESSDSASESDEQSDIYAEPRLDPPRADDKLRLLREFLLRGNAWIENLSRGPSNQRDQLFWEEVRRSLDTPRVFPTWSRAATVFRNVIGNRQWKAGKSMLDPPPRGPKGDKDRLIDRCVAIVNQRKALEMFIKHGLVTLESVPGMVRDGSLQCIIKELGAASPGHLHANQQAAKQDDETDSDGSASESDESAVTILSLGSEPVDGHDTPASSPVPDRLAAAQGLLRSKRGREDGEAAPCKRRRIGMAQDDTQGSDEETSGLSAPQTFVATVKKLIRLELGKETAKYRKQFDKSIRASCQKVENRVLGKIDGLLTKLSKGKAREM